jgi:shikimate dehydrogenase
VTARYVVLGDPIAHSLSPALFSRLFPSVGSDARMERRRCAPAELPAVFDELRAGILAGASVTLPLKELALSLADEAGAGAAAVGAANCLVARAGRVRAENTDVDGIEAALREAGVPLRGARVVVLGAGGAARAAVFAAFRGGAADVHVCNRDPARAAALVAKLGGTSSPLTREAVAGPLSRASLLIQATSVGLRAPEDDPLPQGVALPEGLALFELVYRPLRTALVRRARGPVIDGLSLLVAQAAVSLQHFTGRAAPSDVTGALHDALAEEAT